MQPDTRLVIVNFPHNPTGYLPAAETWAALLDIMRHHGCLLYTSDPAHMLLFNHLDDMRHACEGEQVKLVWVDSLEVA